MGGTALLGVSDHLRLSDPCPGVLKAPVVTLHICPRFLFLLRSDFCGVTSVP